MKKILLLFLFIGISITLSAQPNRPRNPVPIDGGLVILAAAGAKLGYSYFRKRKDT